MFASLQQKEIHLNNKILYEMSLLNFKQGKLILYVINQLNNNKKARNQFSIESDPRVKQWAQPTADGFAIHMFRQIR